ncbi:CD4-2 molecule, tandem duplicate 2 [Anabas testudineus]|uniref:Ig-like domain-containing protein n=1 Tax=Anabas testudineus TaxID=64144 RepID=A0A3Q1JB01_ANATE|nr:CD4-2 molecule, tandem duplicate 2 [Anabas testudineus]XP_026226406.1 CD4-2 molecule, tandem duplicate 2 [Anabas testudineus]XP_026226407.1 CD4-2 molecule, tandem duplicate 2 [Anabas testudineus]
MKIIVLFGFVLGAVCVAGKVVFTTPGKKATLECGANTFSNTLTWRYKDQVIYSTQKRGYPRKGKTDLASRTSVIKGTSLQISDVKEGDAGAFSCEADRIQHEHTLVVFSVSPSSPCELESGWEATLQCQVKGPTSGYTVQWRKPDGTTDKSGTAKLESVALSDAGNWTCMITYGGETHSENLVVKVKAFVPPTTAPSTKQNSNEEPGCTDCATDRNGVLRLDWWVWVAVGVGGLIVLLLMVFVIFMCKRIKRRKRKIRGMKYRRQPMEPKEYCQCTRPPAAARPQQGRRKEKPTVLLVQPPLM